MRFFFLGVFLSLSAVAADKGGNGGGVHYCAHKDSYEVYDLYEGFARYNIAKTAPLGDSVENYVDKAFRKIFNHNVHFGMHLEEVIKRLKEEGRFLLIQNIDLSVVDDAEILLVDKGCTYKQLANWDDYSDHVIVDAEIYQRLDNFNKAALFIHEAVYKTLRNMERVKTSVKARRIVAEAFSDGPLTSLKAGNDGLVTTVRPKEREFRVIKENNAPYRIDLHFGESGEFPWQLQGHIIESEIFFPDAKKKWDEAMKLVATHTKKIDLSREEAKKISYLYHRASGAAKVGYQKAYYDKLRQTDELITEANRLDNLKNALFTCAYTRKEKKYARFFNYQFSFDLQQAVEGCDNFKLTVKIYTSETAVLEHGHYPGTIDVVTSGESSLFNFTIEDKLGNFIREKKPTVLYEIKPSVNWR